jgi:CheY-like chemotaxis protein
MRDHRAGKQAAEGGNGVALTHSLGVVAMSGVELCKHLIGAGSGIPTILVTAYPNDVDRARALNEGAVRYLRKPTDENS